MLQTNTTNFCNSKINGNTSCPGKSGMRNADDSAFSRHSLRRKHQISRVEFDSILQSSWKFLIADRWQHNDHIAGEVGIAHFNTPETRLLKVHSSISKFSFIFQLKDRHTKDAYFWLFDRPLPNCSLQANTL